MAVCKSAMEIFSVLDKSNCKKCGEKTCLAFAGAVYLGSRRIDECPNLDEVTIAGFSDDTAVDKSLEEAQDQYVTSMLREVTRLDFEQVAKRINAQLEGKILSVPILGKKIGIQQDGTFSTDLHIIPWVISPLLDYVLHCKGLPVSGDWISFREIKGGKEKYALFKKRGEEVLKYLADNYTDFFDDIVHMFNGKTVEKRFESDVSVVLYPFPLVPIMLCYWKPEEDLESSLNLFFDKTINDNLGIDSTYSLGAGFARMVEKLAEHHGF